MDTTEEIKLASSSSNVENVDPNQNHNHQSANQSYTCQTPAGP